MTHASEAHRWADQLDDLCSRLAPRFSRVEPRRRARAYLQGIFRTGRTEDLAHDRVEEAHRHVPSWFGNWGMLNSSLVPSAGHGGTRPEQAALEIAEKTNGG